VLTEIFEFLNVEDLKRIGLTSKHWFQVSSEPKFLRRLQVLIYNHEDCEKWPGKIPIPSALKLFSDSLRNFENFYFHAVKLDSKNGNAFWAKYAPIITHMELMDCQIGGQYLVQLLQKMPNLRHLVFNNMGHARNWRQHDFDRMKGQLKIQHLGWNDENPITEVMFKSIFGMASNGLESVLLNGIESTHDATSLNFGALRLHGHLTKETFLSFLQKHQNNLKSIDLGEIGTSKLIIPALLKAPSPSVTLEAVNIKSVPADINPDDLNKFLWNHKLKQLSLTHVSANNETMWAISEMVDVEGIKIVQDPKRSIDGEGLKLLYKLKTLVQKTLNVLNVYSKEIENTPKLLYIIRSIVKNRTFAIHQSTSWEYKTTHQKNFPLSHF
jgi:hypothetical protein